MSVPDDVRRAVGRALGVDVEDARPVGGGCISDACVVELADGRTAFLKTHRGADPRMFPAEARGLAWLAEGGALRVPEVLAVSRPEAGDPPFLLLEHLPPGRRRGGFDEELGRGLAALHGSGCDLPGPGLDHDNFIGSLPQANGPCATWAEFYRRRRLEPLAAGAHRRGLLSRTHVAGFERLFGRLDELVGPPEPPARLHGDLWSGNLHVGPDGAPALIDPAVYAGHREMDLAMMRLFGGFGEACFRAYDEALPLAAGHGDRVPLYQLYPLLVHVLLFGGGYVRQLASALDRALSI